MKPTNEYRFLLYQAAGVHMQAIVLCREQLEAFEALLKAAVPGDTQASALDFAEWRGQSKILAWKESGLRPMALRCLKDKAREPGLEALNILVDVNLRCRLKLSSYRRVCEDAAFPTSVHIRLLNDAIDEFAWLGARLERMVSISNEFIDLPALEEYRVYLRKLREDLVRVVLVYFGKSAVLSAVSVGKSHADRSVKVIQSSRFGPLVGSRGADSNGVNFIDAYTGMVFAAFKRSAVGGDWQYVPVSAKAAEAHHYINSLQLIRRADSTLMRLPKLEANPLLSTRAVRAELEQLAQAMFEDVQITMAARENAQGHDPLHERLVAQLNEKANTLIRVAREVQQRMILAREPDTQGLEDLVTEGVVEIKEVSGTHRAPGTGTPPLFRSFYIQKVRANSLQAPHIIWFAHFHYAPEQTDALSFTSAHLKRYDSPYESFGHQLRTAQGNNERMLNVYRASIDRAAAQKLFFTDEVVVAQ